jgi:Asp-tRNA(Asn)/Glu-tRNA(Gln) amidotransferase A subunit family amidase
VGREAGQGRPAGDRAGPLDGTVVAVKDLVAVAGLPLGAGSRTRAAAPPEPRDAACVAALRAAGAVVAGTVALHELAFGVTGINDQVGFPAHPHDGRRIPGGSSSGSAVAVATGACDLAVGTDTGGSVRIPAALCGVVGFKPARGRYSLDGVVPLSPTLDHLGLLARSVDAVAAGHRVLAATATATAGTGVGDVSPVAPTRLGVDREALAAAAGPVADAVDAALRALHDRGCQLVDIRWPDLTEVVDVSSTILLAEAAAVHRRLVGRSGAAAPGADIAPRLAAGAAITSAAHREACRARDGLAAAVVAVLATVDAVAGPAVPVPAPTIEQARADQSLPRALVSATRLANLAGTPAITLPLSGADLPVGLQLQAGDDERLLRIAGAVAPWL